MEDFTTQLIDNVKEFFATLDTARKVGLFVVLGITLAVMSAIIIWASKTQYRTLYSDLNGEDSTQIARILEEKKIPYQFADDGKVIKVPEDKVEVWRLELAKMGMSFTGTVGYEVFDNQPFGTTSFVQKINRQRALEGELVKTIMHLDGVKRARVHLTIPENSPFVSQRKPPAASVVIDLDRGVVLTHDEIRGIGSLVSSSVDGLRPEAVVIIDSKGKKLSENIGDQMTLDTANRISLESKMNRKLEQQVEEILGKVVGEGKVIAKVSVNLDFTESVSTETSFDGENAAVLSEVANTQKLEGSRPSPQGIPGARSNLPGETPQPGIPETRNNVDKSLTTKNYNVPSKVTKSRNPTANLKNLSVAVMVDNKAITVFDEAGQVQMTEAGLPVTKREPWTEADLENFKAIVASAIGVSDNRGDKIVIRNMDFATEDLAAVEAMMRERENREILKNLIKYVVIGLIITLFFFIVVRPFIQWVTENTVESVEDFLPKTIEELEKIQANQKLPGLEDALPQIEEKLNPEKVEGNMLKEKIVSLVEGNPTKAAQIIHEMIHANDASKEIA